LLNAVTHILAVGPITDYLIGLPGLAGVL